MVDHARRQTRRKVTLESLSLAVPIAAAFFFSGVFIVAWSQATSLLLAMGVSVPLVVFWIFHRRRFPANIAPPSPEPDKEPRDGEDDGRWDWFTLLLLGASLIVVVVGGVVARFVVPLAVIVLFGVGHSGPDLWYATVAAGCTLAVAFVLEFGIVLPLSKLWNLAIDEDPRPRDDFCPK